MDLTQLRLMTFSHISNISGSPPAHPPAVHFPICNSFLINIQYKYTF